MSNVFVWLCFLLLQQIFTIIQRLWWTVQGIAKQQRERRTAFYESSAQVLVVRAKCMHYLAYGPLKRHFIATHSRFDHPNCVLAREVTLYLVSATEAIFVRSCPDIDVFDSRVHPFSNTAQFEQARELIVVPIQHFHRLAEEVGDPRAPVICLSNTGRCGSTIVSQMMEKVPGVLAISEPYAMVNIRFLEYNGVVTDKDEIKKLVTSTMRLICKPRPEEVLFYFVKQSMGSEYVEHVTSVIPGVKNVFLYRGNVIKHVMSYHRVHMHCFGPLYKAKEFCVTRAILPWHAKRALDFALQWGQMSCLWIEKDDENSLNLPIDEMFLLRAHRLCQLYCKIRCSCDVLGVRYEDLVEHPTSVCEAIAEHCGLPRTFVEMGPSALKTDSQLNASWTNKMQNVAFDEEKMKSLFELCKQFNMPDINKEWHLPGTFHCTN